MDIDYSWLQVLYILSQDTETKLTFFFAAQQLRTIVQLYVSVSTDVIQDGPERALEVERRKSFPYHPPNLCRPCIFW